MSPSVSAFGGPAVRAAVEHVSVVQQSIEHGGDGGVIAQQLAPVLNGLSEVNNVLARS